jgi:urease beta subunit
LQNIPAGTSIRFEPGETKTVPLVEIGGKLEKFKFSTSLFERNPLVRAQNHPRR